MFVKTARCDRQIHTVVAQSACIVYAQRGTATVAYIGISRYVIVCIVQIDLVYQFGRAVKVECGGKIRPLDLFLKRENEGIAVT